jgi:hypothetical protein
MSLDEKTHAGEFDMALGVFLDCIEASTQED